MQDYAIAWVPKGLHYFALQAIDAVLHLANLKTLHRGKP
jgi:hypothetical protein